MPASTASSGLAAQSDINALAAKSDIVCRRLVNPAVRVALRPDMPPVIDRESTAHLLAVLKAELAKCGDTLQTAGEITIAFPQKDPDLFRSHVNSGKESAGFVAGAIRQAITDAGEDAAQLKLTIADAICETRHLDRSFRTGVMHSLTARQVFCVNARRHAKKPIAFLDPARAGGRHYFVIADWLVSSATTMANLASFIEHNGGHVLAAVADCQHLYRETEFLPSATAVEIRDMPDKKGWLSDAFADPARSDAMERIAYLLAKSAWEQGVKITANQALANAEKAVNRCGHSLKALTDPEFRSLVRDLQGGSTSYKGFLDCAARVAKAQSKADAKSRKSGLLEVFKVT